MIEGNMHPSVQIIAPGIPAVLIPTNVAEFIAIEPGVISAMVIKSVNSDNVKSPNC